MVYSRKVCGYETEIVALALIIGSSVLSGFIAGFIIKLYAIRVKFQDDHILSISMEPKNGKVTTVCKKCETSCKKTCGKKADDPKKSGDGWNSKPDDSNKSSNGWDNSQGFNDKDNNTGNGWGSTN